MSDIVSVWPDSAMARRISRRCSSSTCGRRCVCGRAASDRCAPNGDCVGLSIRANRTSGRDTWTLFHPQVSLASSRIQGSVSGWPRTWREPRTVVAHSRDFVYSCHLAEKSKTLRACRSQLAEGSRAGGKHAGLNLRLRYSIIRQQKTREPSAPKIVLAGFTLSTGSAHVGRIVLSRFLLTGRASMAGFPPDGAVSRTTAPELCGNPHKREQGR